MSIINREEKGKHREKKIIIIIIASSRIFSHYSSSGLFSLLFFRAYFILHSSSLFYIRSLPWCPLLFSLNPIFYTQQSTQFYSHTRQQGINVLTDRRESSLDSSLVLPFCLEAIIWNLPNLKVKTHHSIIQPESAQNRSHEGERRERWKIGLWDFWEKTTSTSFPFTSWLLLYISSPPSLLRIGEGRLMNHYHLPIPLSPSSPDMEEEMGKETKMSWLFGYLSRLDEREKESEEGWETKDPNSWYHRHQNNEEGKILSWLGCESNTMMCIFLYFMSWDERDDADVVFSTLAWFFFANSNGPITSTDYSSRLLMSRLERW